MKQSKQVNENQHIITYVTLHFLCFFYGSKQYLWKWNWFNKVFLKKEGANGKWQAWRKKRHVGGRKERLVWKVDMLQNFFHCGLVNSISCSFLFRGCLQMQLMLLSYNFVLLKVLMTTCFKWTNYYFLLLSLFIILQTIFLWFSS